VQFSLTAKLFLHIEATSQVNMTGLVNNRIPFAIQSSCCDTVIQNSHAQNEDKSDRSYQELCSRKLCNKILLDDFRGIVTIRHVSHNVRHEIREQNHRAY
jgi:hypothetical protein